MVDYNAMKEIVGGGKSHLIIDASPENIYKKCKIPGSINIPPSSVKKENIEKHIKGKLKYKGKNVLEQPIVVYSKNTDCGESLKLKKLLIKFGFTNVSEYTEGVMGWVRQQGKDSTKCDKQTGKWYKNKQSPKFINDSDTR